ncbi:Uu.00g137770.m01.CDS01 [Anthostomella pinea]|uniref:Uu.00g137770.m01.CDS01 n=1 Tax=Anthostomella pinea TaxID=933095 RepID=A0AAI8VPM4_9PEZI|nr:Uu.00g137770.m01.CDS01 [Anthostomella pinea]
MPNPSVSDGHHGTDEPAPDDTASEGGSELDEEYDSVASNDLLELEAIESGDKSSSDGGDEDQISFAQFSRLPIELRQLIWEFFCPDLLGNSSSMIELDLIRTKQDACSIWEGVVLEQQTATARAVLATNHESRTLAMKAYPDVIEI